MDGDNWVVKRDGSINEGAVQALAKAGIWNGDWDAFNEAPPSVNVLVTVEENVYDGRKSYRASWVSPDADEPRQRGGFKPADKSVLASLRARFGGQIRAIAGGNTSGTAPAPPSANPASAPTPAPSGPAHVEGGPGKEGTPF